MSDGLNIAVLTVSDTRTADTDTSGQFLEDALLEAGHRLADRTIVIDDIYQIRARLSAWIADSTVHAILVTGGTGFSGRDSTPEAVLPLFDKTIEGFGEVFRALSLQEIGSSTAFRASLFKKFKRHYWRNANRHGRPTGCHNGRHRKGCARP